MKMDQQEQHALLQLAQMEIKKREPKFCINCKHYRLARECPAGSQHRCDRLEADLVTGKETRMDALCDIQRCRPQTADRCGPEATFWEPLGA